eukprot:CAMPEP_0202978314 /NCGR_PEP_ID=MMETSP1396-20130829/84779_1 /ASSEMBLY_ACC=CAM_ASM_000872 /TAXON_ID= /ORGANISM="Pseudokeronopsis sp., Strain Brazil" /LENGTH=64 /DNA_ID=CAMNT_0049717241 /DNA_START=695 /DNA_END=889 /DNA_ORIENTATION=-
MNILSSEQDMQDYSNGPYFCALLFTNIMAWACITDEFLASIFQVVVTLFLVEFWFEVDEVVKVD